MTLHLEIAGWLLIVLAFAHLFFPGYFKWASELKTLSLINRQMMYIHTLFIGLVLLLMGALCVVSSKELLETALGNKIVLGLGIFWIVRLIVQFVGYSSLLWKGKKFETFVHIGFSLLWGYFSTVFMLAYSYSLN